MKIPLFTRENNIFDTGTISAEFHKPIFNFGFILGRSFFLKQSEKKSV